jgi:metallo-beta-lactamase family protein
MKLGFYGAAGEVTGSRFLLQAGGVRVLLDCGLFQGHRKESLEKNRFLPFNPEELDAVCVSHAHIDHSGLLPLLCKSGFTGSIHCTRPTAELAGIMLMDSARHQEEDAKFFNKIHRDTGQTIEPLYDDDDAKRTLGLFEGHSYAEEFPLGKGMSARLLNAGHVLGSAMIQVTIETKDGCRRILFTGDLGRRKTILMDPPDVPENVDYLIIESTYGDRVHNPIVSVEKSLTEIVSRAVVEKGKILIPSFALERTQEIVFVLEKLKREGAIPPIPLYVDSPMVVNITEIFSRYLDCFSFSPDFKAYVAREGNPFAFETVYYVRTPEESKRLNHVPGPLIILAGSGMCEGGRILHHLRNNIDKNNTTILIVGYQAEGTLGRRIANRAKSVRIFGMEHNLRARVEILQTFSSHADRDDLLHFIGSLSPRPRSIFLVHGDPSDRQTLASYLKAMGIDRVELPEFRQVYDLE